MLMRFVEEIAKFQDKTFLNHKLTKNRPKKNQEKKVASKHFRLDDLFTPKTIFHLSLFN